MESRWVLLGVGLLFAILAIVQVRRGNLVSALVAVVFTIFGIGGFWWNSTRATPLETRFSRSR